MTWKSHQGDPISLSYDVCDNNVKEYSIEDNIFVIMPAIQDT